MKRPNLNLPADLAVVTAARGGHGWEVASDTLDEMALRGAIEAAGYNAQRAYINRHGCVVVRFTEPQAPPAPRYSPAGERAIDAALQLRQARRGYAEVQTDIRARLARALEDYDRETAYYSSEPVKQAQVIIRVFQTIGDTNVRLDLIASRAAAIEMHGAVLDALRPLIEPEAQAAVDQMLAI
jgi:hypothetical protein